MPMTIQRWERRDGADMAEFGLAVLQYCRTGRALEGVVDCRYWIEGNSRLVVMTEFEDGTNALRPEFSPTSVAALTDLEALGRESGTEFLMDASLGAEMMKVAQTGG